MSNYPRTVRSRAWPSSVAIAIGTVAILVRYLKIISRQGNSPAAWFVAVVVLAGSLPLLGLIVRSIRALCFALSAGVLSVLAFLAGFSIGVFILPVAVLAWVAFAIDPSHANGPVIAPAGWYPDPGDENQSRYWDGTVWTGYVA